MEADRLASADNILASRSLPPAIRTSIETLLDEYTQLERLRSSWLLQEHALKAKVEAMEREKTIESKARASLAARIGVLEHALKTNRCPDPGDDRHDFHLPIKMINVSQDGALQSTAQLSLLRPTAADKYKTLPCNFMSRKTASSGTRMLWKYLEELGYKPSASPANDSLANDQENIAEQPNLSPAEKPGPVLKSPAAEKTPNRSDPDETATAADDNDDEQNPSSEESSFEETLPPPPSSSAAAVLPNPDTVHDQGYSFDWACTAPPEMQWKPKLTLMHHLDAVRSIAFHESAPALFTGSEDGADFRWFVGLVFYL